MGRLGLQEVIPRAGGFVGTVWVRVRYGVPAHLAGRMRIVTRGEMSANSNIPARAWGLHHEGSPSP